MTWESTKEGRDQPQKPSGTPGAVRPEWEGEPAHIQRLLGTEAQVDGFNANPNGPWVIYVESPSGGTAQLQGTFRLYPDCRNPPPHSAHEEKEPRRIVMGELRMGPHGSEMVHPPSVDCECWEGCNDREGKMPCPHERLPISGGPFDNTRNPGLCRCGAEGPPWKHKKGCRYD